MTHPAARATAPATVGLLLITLTLSGLPAAADHATAPPYIHEWEFTGLIGCSAAYDPLQTTDLCQDIDPNAKTTFEFPLNSGMTGLVIRLEATATTPLGDEFRIDWMLPVQMNNGTDGPVAGPAPLEGRYTFNAEEDPWTMMAQDAIFKVTGNPGADTPQVHYQTALTIHIGVFYNGAPIPDDYVPGA